MTDEARRAFFAAVETDAGLRAALKRALAGVTADGDAGVAVDRIAREHGHALDPDDLAPLRGDLEARDEGILGDDQLDGVGGAGNLMHYIRSAQRSR